jgi:hypothetical protein
VHNKSSKSGGQKFRIFKAAKFEKIEPPLQRQQSFTKAFLCEAALVLPG